MFYNEQKEKGLFKVKHKNEISNKEMNFILDELRKDIEKSDLMRSSQHAMSDFIQKQFPTIWEADKD